MSEQRGTQSDSGERTSAERGTPPWQRATSQASGEQGEPAVPSASGQLTEDYQGEDDQPTMIHEAVRDDDHERLFAPHDREPAGNSGGGRTSVSLPGTGNERGGGTPSALRRPGRGPRRASLQVKRVDPWSVLKLAFVLSLACFLVLMVAVGVLYAVLGGMGVWDKINGTYTDLVSPGGGSPEPLITIGRVFGVTAIVGVVNIILFTAVATVSAFVYNVSADLAGGLEVTLAERE